MFSLESPHRVEAILISTPNIPFSKKKKKKERKKITANYPESAAMGFFEGTQEKFRNSRGKRATSVRATEGLLYMYSDVGQRINRLIIVPETCI